jgi:hypothetical protein
MEGKCLCGKQELVSQHCEELFSRARQESRSAQTGERSCASSGEVVEWSGYEGCRAHFLCEGRTMIFRTAACILLCLVLPGLAQTVVTVPLTDSSAPGSPLHVTGNITFTDQILGNSVVSSSKYALRATNVSGKGIVFMLVRFREGGTRGGGIDHIIQWDNFFWNEEIAPDETFVLDRSRGGFQTQCCINPLESGVEPVAELSVRYVEFADGSTWGGKSEAADILATRSLIVERLGELDATRDDHSFVRLLGQKLKSDEADGFFERVRLIQKSGGTAAARSQVRRYVGNATRHLGAMRAASVQRPD